MNSGLPKTPGGAESETLSAEHVKDLSLKELTKQYGTHGLYLRVGYELERTGLADDTEVSRALQFGLALHAEDLRTNGPYVDHIMRVGIRIISRYGITDPNIIAAAFLHDSVEDHAADIVNMFNDESMHSHEDSIYDEALWVLGKYFSPKTMELVNQLTFVATETDAKRRKVEYADYTRRLVFDSNRARIIKLSDFVDNALGNHFTEGEKREDLDEKYLPLYDVHRMGLYLPDSLIAGATRAELNRQLVRGRARTISRLALSQSSVSE